MYADAASAFAAHWSQKQGCGMQDDAGEYMGHTALIRKLASRPANFSSRVLTLWDSRVGWAVQLRATAAGEGAKMEERVRSHVPSLASSGGSGSHPSACANCWARAPSKHGSRGCN